MNNSSYSYSAFFSFALHGLLVLFLVMDIQLPQAPSVDSQKKAKKTVIQATNIDQSKVMAEVQRLQQVAKQKKIDEQNRMARLNKQLAAAKQRRINEERRLKRLKQEAARERQKQLQKNRLAAKKLKQLKRKQQQEQQRLKQLQAKKAETLKKQKQEQQRLAALEKKRQQEKEQALKEEQARKAALKAKQLAEQKKEQARLSGLIGKYKALIIQAISEQWILPHHVDKSLSCKFEIKIAPTGQVLSVRLLRSSGDSVLDRSAQTAIYKASPLPVPREQKAYELFRTVSLTVRPEGLLSNA